MFGVSENAPRASLDRPFCRRDGAALSAVLPIKNDSDLSVLCVKVDRFRGKADYPVNTDRSIRQELGKESASGQNAATLKSWQYMDWHIINHKDYIDGPFDSFEAALAEACALGNETRPEPRVKRRSDQFFVYRAPYDREEKWRPEFWICTKEGALRLGVPEDLFNQPLLEMAVGVGSLESLRARSASGTGGE